MGWEQVVAVDELRAAGRGAYQVGSREVAIFSEGESFIAVQAGCPHRAAPLVQGTLVNGTLTCPAHFWKFDMSSGECQTNLSPECRLKKYKTKEENGTVMIYISDFDVD